MHDVEDPRQVAQETVQAAQAFVDVKNSPLAHEVHSETEVVHVRQLLA